MTDTITAPAEAGTYTVVEMAALLRCTPKAIYHRVTRKQIPSWVVVRYGRRLEFRRDAVARWLAGEEA